MEEIIHHCVIKIHASMMDKLQHSTKPRSTDLWPQNLTGRENIRQINVAK